MADQSLTAFAETTAIEDTDIVAVRKDSSDSIWRYMTGANLKAAIRDLNGNKLTLDADGDTSITADTDDQVDFEVGGSDVARLDDVSFVGSFRSQDNVMTLADDEAGSVEFSGNTRGMAIISSNDTSRGIAIVHFIASSAGAQIASLATAISSGAVDVTTGVLSGTTGTDGNVTISAHTDNKIYVENRTGGTGGYQFTFLALQGAGLASL